MKISKSKQELARIISENGGWRNGAEWAAQDKSHAGRLRKVVFYCGGKPWIDAGDDCWGGNNTHDEFIISDRLIKNWHQTILSRAEYFHLYPAPDADGWIEWKGGECPVGEGDLIDVKFIDGDELFCVDSSWDWGEDADGYKIIAYRLHRPAVDAEFCESVTRSIPEPAAKPTIEQLAADCRNLLDLARRKQQEADAAKADVEAKLAELVAAGAALGLMLSIAEVGSEPELVITDWRDLRVGDVVELISFQGGSAKVGEIGEISKFFGNGDFHVDFPSQSGYSVDHSHIKFIRRP